MVGALTNVSDDRRRAPAGRKIALHRYRSDRHAIDRVYQKQCGTLLLNSLLAYQQQIILQAGSAFEHMAAQATAMTANAWLEDLIPRYEKVKLTDDVVRVEHLIRARSEEVKSAMVPMGVPFDVTPEQMAEWADEVAGESREEGLKLLAMRCLLRPDQLAQEVLQLKVVAPLNAMIPVSIMGPEGFTEASIGSVDNDLEGRTYQMAANHLGIDEIFIDAAFQRIEEKHGLTADDLLEVLMASPFVGKEQEHLIRLGLEAWKAGDAIKAVHILVPQVEVKLPRQNGPQEAIH